MDRSTPACKSQAIRPARICLADEERSAALAHFPLPHLIPATAAISNLWTLSIVDFRRFGDNALQSSFICSFILPVLLVVSMPQIGHGKRIVADSSLVLTSFLKPRDQPLRVSDVQFFQHLVR